MQNLVSHVCQDRCFGPDTDTIQSGTRLFVGATDSAKFAYKEWRERRSGILPLLRSLFLLALRQQLGFLRADLGFRSGVLFYSVLYPFP